MRTLLFATAWAEDQQQIDRRIGGWIKHHLPLPYPCDVALAVIGDGIAPEIRWPPGDYEKVNLYPHLGRPSHLNYPGWWRSFAYAAKVARDLRCQRIWHVESDFFIASQRILHKMNEIEEGWIAFWCPRHGFPETAVQVITEGCFDRLSTLGTDCTKFAGQHAEAVIPFTTIVREMIGDRYGETSSKPEEIEGLDFYGQWSWEREALFRR